MLGQKKILKMHKKLNFYKFFLYIYYKLKFLSHNKKIFKNKKENYQNIILIEINNFYPNHILYSYLSNQLSKKFKAEIVGYFPNRAISFKKKIKYLILRLIPLNRISLYKSFGLKKILNLNDLIKQISINKIDRTYRSIRRNISQKKIINLKIENIYLGDLIYDDYLRKYFVGRIDINNKLFLDHLYNFIKTFYLWKYYLKKKNVKSIILSHDVYEYAIPLRVAQNLGIPVYVPDAYRLFLFDKKKNHLLDNKMYQEINSSLTINEKTNLMLTAKKKLKEKFSAKADEFIEFSEKNLVTRNIKDFLKNKKNFFSKKKTNILVACHCFYDAPHCFGKFFYDDFVDWLENLGKISEKTDYKWFLKKHPHSLNHTLANKILGEFLEKYPKFKIIPEDIDNRSFKNSIDFVLTVHGSVAWEMAYLNKPVILASRPDHLKKFNFCIKPQSRQEYEKILLNLSKQKNNILKKDIFKFFYLNYICIHDFGKLSLAKKLLKDKYFTPKIFNYWINNFNNNKHTFLTTELKEFLKNNKNLLWNKKSSLQKF